MNNSSTNTGGWPSSDLRTYANGEFLNKLPSNLQDAIIDTKVISGQHTHVFKKRIYAKNLGTHKAYNVNLVGSNQNISIQKETLRSNEKCYIDISAEIPKGDKGIRTISIKLEYTQLP